MTYQEAMTALEKMGSPSTKKVLLKHGAVEPFFGVKVGDMKSIVKAVKKDHELSLQLFKSGNADAQYLAGLIADEKKISKANLNEWVKTARWNMISEYSVAWVTSESAFAWELGLDWINSDKEQIASTGWCTLAYICNLVPDDQLDKKTYKQLLARVVKEIAKAPDRVRSCMNLFLINVGGMIPDLSNDAIKAAQSIGVVTVIKEGTACKVPAAEDYIKKMVSKGVAAKKKKTVRC
jgi:hypothetical protein